MREYVARNAERINAQKRARYRANPERVLEAQREYNARPAVRDRMCEYNRQYQVQNVERVAVQRAEYRTANRDAIRETGRRDYQAHKDERRAQGLARYHRNPQATIDRNRDWRRRNPDKVLAKNQRRRARRVGAHVEDVVTSVVFENAGGLCGICGLAVARKDVTLDHITPLSRGGEHSYRNIQLAHRRCNSSKGTSIPLA